MNLKYLTWTLYWVVDGFGLQKHFFTRRFEMPYGITEFCVTPNDTETLI